MSEALLLNDDAAEERHVVRKVSKINLEAHEGLRGAAAVWIMIFHCFRAYRGSDIDFQGSSLMPLFFLLTGFTLAIVYNKIFRPEEGKVMEENRKMSYYWGFLRNRLIRVAPVYYLMSAVAVPFWLLGFGDADPRNTEALVGSVVTTSTFTSTIFLFCLGSPLDGPAWTVQTFLWFWIFFPEFMKRTRLLTTLALSNWIVYFYWIQLVACFVVFAAFLFVSPLGFWPAFCAATMNPIFRFPLFLMGIFAGELRVRGAENTVPSLRSVWPRSLLYALPHVCNIDGTWEQEEEQIRWTLRAKWLAFFLFSSTMIVAGANSLAGTNIFGALWFQAFVPFAQLEFIVSLTMQSTESLLHRALTTPLAKFLGKISMTIYLVHYVVIWAVEWGIFGFHSVPWPTGAKRQAENSNGASASDDNLQVEWDAARQLPLWGIPLVASITLPLASFIYFCFEEPIRRTLYVK
jgi:peptidoglycan/LPS O-acetylase OafA/YrhL